jgi:hypothetical protein
MLVGGKLPIRAPWPKNSATHPGPTSASTNFSAAASMEFNFNKSAAGINGQLQTRSRSPYDVIRATPLRTERWDLGKWGEVDPGDPDYKHVTEECISVSNGPH